MKSKDTLKAITVDCGFFHCKTPKEDKFFRSQEVWQAYRLFDFKPKIDHVQNAMGMSLK